MDPERRYLGSQPLSLEAAGSAAAIIGGPVPDDTGSPAGVTPQLVSSGQYVGTDIEKQGTSGTELLRFLSAILKPRALQDVVPTVARARAAEWVAVMKAEGKDPVAAIDEILPPPEWFQARLVHLRDKYDLDEAARAGGAYGKAYQAVQAYWALARQTSPAMEAILDEVWQSSDIHTLLKSEPSPVLKKSERWIPGRSSLRTSHQFALDVFFTSIRRHGVEETGPIIRSVSSGIVVAASGDWNGGDKPSNYRSGGLSPKAGNGAIVYDPVHRRYFAYFHLHDVYVRTGQVIESGYALGSGGNTGTNARKKEHGGHVHIEIHDADGDAWSVYSIREFLLSIH